MVSELVDKAEKALSGQRHHSSTNDKTVESWKLNHPWLIVFSNRHRDQTEMFSLF